MTESLAYLGEMFDDYRAVIYENDPQNSAIWSHAKENPKLMAIQETIHLGMTASAAERKTPCGRTRLMAHYRNKLLETIRSFHDVNSFPGELLNFKSDFVIMLDLDLFPRSLNKDSFWSMMRNFEKRIQQYGADQFDVMCSNGLRKGKYYYDRYSLSTCDAAFYKTLWPKEEKLDTSSLSNLLAEEGGELVRVRSCFGGFAIYRTEAIVSSQCSYQTQESCYCEHLPFNLCLAHNGFDSIFIDQGMRFTAIN
jgi:hypothetical protein